MRGEERLLKVGWSEAVHALARLLRQTHCGWEMVHPGRGRIASVVRVLMRQRHTHPLAAAAGGTTASLEGARNGVTNIHKMYCSQGATQRDFFFLLQIRRKPVPICQQNDHILHR